MKATELMIGDWIQVPPSGMRKMKITQLCEDWGDMDDVEPIPLTAEILEKNGFSRKGHDHYHYEVGDYGALAGYPMFGGFTEIFFQYNDTKLRMQIRFVHQLQHALKLCGIEKQIEL